jgi:tetratricopeptide (TPR) repeat protein
MFLERRVYQGSSGKVYPLPFIDRISAEKTDRSWEAVRLENEFLRVLLLPQLGGRIHVGQDKTNGYDFFYRQKVIKPALVGLAGPWISGGVEINWPQHHRPSTFLPADVSVERHADGSSTVWLSEHEPMNRMKGMHGICLHPGKAYLELKARVYNRTSQPQTFLWWANMAARVHEDYQSFFPPDVSAVADHAKRAMSAFPRCAGRYYGIDYAGRVRRGVPAEEQSRRFPPAPGRAPNDLSWYANIPVPTSYMAIGSSGDFFGGYDHARQAGVVHVANHHVSPGKKQWTWGNHEFGYAWERNLTDADGPYIELMAGAYTDNQPDFSFLLPGETKTWSQFWYPIQRIGPAQQANLEAAVSLHSAKGRARVGVSVSSRFKSATVRLEAGGRPLRRWTRDLAPGDSFVATTALPAGTAATDLRLSVGTAEGIEIISYAPRRPGRRAAVAPADEPPAPADVAGNDELYLIGVHLEQYRHATRAPEAYWREALRRDPGDSRCQVALGRWRARRGELAAAEAHFRAAVARLTRRNPNPPDGEAHYQLGLVLRDLGRPDEAYAALYKATWNQAWQPAGFHALAEIDCRRGRWSAALDHLDRALRVNADNLKARDLRVLVLRRLGRAAEAERGLRTTLALDPLDWWARYLRGGRLACDTQVRLDLTLDFARAGFHREALGVLRGATPEPGSGTAPLVEYYGAWLCRILGDAIGQRRHLRAAAQASPDYCFPARVEEIAILEEAIAANPGDARAPYYLGNLLYDRRRHAEAIRRWEEAARLDRQFPIAWRNLGIGYFNVLGRPARARAAYERAFRANPADARLLYERDQLWKRLGVSARTRRRELEAYPDLVRRRDDLAVELAALHNQTGGAAEARRLLAARVFQPWEGGEGQALGQYARALLALGRAELRSGHAAAARELFAAALSPPHSLGETRHLLGNSADIHFWMGEACARAGDEAAARRHWKVAAAFRGDFQQMSVRAFSEMTYYSALSLERLGRPIAARRLFRELLAYARRLSRERARIDYFATSLPTMLVFEDDLQKRQAISALFLQAQAELGLGRRAAARRLLQRILRRDPSHAAAGDLLAAM